MKRTSFFGDLCRESLIWIFLFGILLGILWVKVKSNLFVNDIDFLGTDLLYEMKYMSVDYSTFVFTVVKKRILPIICIMILATTYLGLAVSYGYAGWLGMSVGLFAATLMIRYGIKGVILFGVAIFPQYLFYLPAWIMLLKGARELCCCVYFPRRCKRTYINGRKDEIRFGIGVIFKVLVVVIIGILMESYVNPKLLLSFLKIF